MRTFYHSTRSSATTVTSKQAILQGLAPDGGLFVTDAVDQMELDYKSLLSKNYQDQACVVLSTLLGDYTDEEIGRCVKKAYSNQFDNPDITPVTKIGDDWLLELFHGPTCAFKDIALQMLPQLMSVARGESEDSVMIVTATSGDTGKAALEGFADVPGCGVTVFYPAGKVSDIQHLQMVCQKGSNVAVCGVRGTFDDTQTGVKEIFSDPELNARLAQRHIKLSSANSINIGRLVPQVTYYFFVYSKLVEREAIKAGDKLDFCVPTGNFGDVLAGYLAKKLDLPIRHLIVASNANNVLTNFITTGRYDRRRPFIKTISPSMDILVSSNLERLLYYESDGDADYVASLMQQLNDEGYYEVTKSVKERIQKTFLAGYADDAVTKKTIKETFENEGRLVDPHTAVAKTVLDSIESDGVQRVCLSTASPFKFSADVLSALGKDTAGKDGFECMDELAKLAGLAAPKQLSELRSAPQLHKDVEDLDQMPAFVENSCTRIFR